MDAKSIGKNIREYRLSKNMSQRNLAEVLFVTNKTISRWECGGGQPDIEQLAKIASVFGVTIDELISSKDLSEDEKKKNENLIVTENSGTKILSKIDDDSVNSSKTDGEINRDDILTEQSFASAKDGNLASKVPDSAYKEKERADKKINKTKVVALILGTVFMLSVIGGGLILALSSETAFNEEYIYIYEAEDALFTESFKVENVANASNGKVAAWLHTEGTSLIFKITSEQDAECVLGLVFNRPRPFVFESKMKLLVNGEQITVGNVEGIGWDGTNEGLYYAFGSPVTVRARLKKGNNEIVLIVVDGMNLNIDYLQATTKADLSLLNKEYKFEAEDAKLSGLYSRIPDKTASGGYKIGDFCIEEENTISFRIISDYRAVVTMEIGLGYPCKNFDSAFLLYLNDSKLTVTADEDRRYWQIIPFFTEITLEKGVNDIIFVNVNATSIDYISFITSLSLEWA